MGTILFYIIQFLIFSSDLTNAQPVVGTITRSAEDKEFSSVVAIGFKHFGPDLASTLFCTGTLITRRHVLTAAHCLAPHNKEQVQVLGGSSRIERCDRYDIEDWITYNEWAANNNLIPGIDDNDIAIITLNRDTDRAKMVPAFISPEVREKHEGLKVAIAGWGRLNDNSKTAVLQTAPVEVLKLTECEKRCSEIMGCRAILHLNAMCSAASATRSDPPSPEEDWASSSCGDSGGPLLYNNNVLLGITLGVCPPQAESKDGMTFHVNLNYYTHFFHHLTSQGLTYRLLH